jgi:hypothetical protein
MTLISRLNIGPMVVCGTALRPGPEQPLLALMDLSEQCPPTGYFRLIPLREHKPFHNGSEDGDGKQ